MILRAAAQAHVEVLGTVPNELRDEKSDGLIVAGQRPSDRRDRVIYTQNTFFR